MINHNIHSAFIKTILYYDIFSYPLKAQEIINYCSIPELDTKEAYRILNELTAKNLINFSQGFYYVGTDKSKIKARIANNMRADKTLKKARKFARIIANFPFVQAVFVSGSLSKRVMKKDSDIDYFIITHVQRLWFSRAMLTFFKKVFLANSHKNFCLNYFIDSQTLVIPNQNIYTATEIAFLIPMYGQTLFLDFLNQNEWYRNEYPNLKINDKIKEIKPLRIKKVFELSFNNSIGNIIDDLCFRFFYKFLKIKYKHLDNRSFSLNLQASKSVSKHHPESHQEKVLFTFNKKIEDFQLSTGFTFSESILQTVQN